MRRIKEREYDKALTRVGFGVSHCGFQMPAMSCFCFDTREVFLIFLKLYFPHLQIKEHKSTHRVWEALIPTLATGIIMTVLVILLVKLME